MLATRAVNDFDLDFEKWLNNGANSMEENKVWQIVENGYYNQPINISARKLILTNVSVIFDFLWLSWSISLLLSKGAQIYQ